MENYYSTLYSWMIPFYRAMEAHGINTKTALIECEISDEVIQNQESRMAAEKFSRLIEYCNNKLNRKDFSILIANQFHPGIFHALGYAMMSSNSLYDALTRIAHYKRVVSNTCELHIEEIGNHYIFKMDIFTYDETERPVLSLITVETFLATIMRFSRELVAPNFTPEKVCFSYQKPNYNTQYLNDYFGCDIKFSSDKNAIVFDSLSCKEKLIGGNPLITQVHEKMLDQFMVRIDQDDLSYTIRNKIFEMLPLGAPSQSDIAVHLGMSLRNLQRKLHAKNTNYKEILKNTRKKLAIDYLLHKHLSLSEISYLVGFSNEGSFNRAFKRWTNKTPGNYRNNTPF